MYTLCIIGGGIQGSSLYVNLPPKIQARTIVIDKHPQALHMFLQYYSRLQFYRLRSPGTHSLSINRRSLLEYAKDHSYPDLPFIGKYMLPLTSLFLAHSRSLIEAHKLHHRWMQATIKDIKPSHSPTPYYKLYSDNNTHICSARYVILALGNDSFSIPPSDCDIRHCHILDRHFSLQGTASLQDGLTIVGGGMSAHQAAVHYGRYCRFNIIAHKKSYITHFDSDPSFIGPKGLCTYRNIHAYSERKHVLKSRRYPGSINRVLQEEFDSLPMRKHRSQYIDRVAYVHYTKKQSPYYTLLLESGKKIQTKDLILATGFAHHQTPHKQLIKAIADSCNFSLYNDGYPVVDEYLKWGGGMYVIGALGESYLGPVARNIIGAHLAFKILNTYLFSTLCEHH